MPESAAAYQARYYTIPVRTIGTPRVVSIAKYESGDVWADKWAKEVYSDLLHFLGTKYHYSHHNHIYSSGFFNARDYPVQIFLEERKLHNCFNGKGSPELFAKALHLIDYYLLKAEIPLKKVGWSRMVTLQEYADYYLGLDCNGFIGTYFSNVFAGSTIGADTHCNDFDNAVHGGVKRKSLAEIKARDVLVREGGSGTRHVALIDSVQPCDSETVWVQLVQSASSKGGLSAISARLKWLKKPAEKPQSTQSVLSVKILDGYEFNYVIGYPFAS
jgi:hypothetical protein